MGFYPPGVGGGAGGGSSPFSCLYLNGNSQHAYHGPFWVVGKKLTNSMRWEAWAQGNPFSGTYLICADYGGSHAILFSGAGGNMNFVDGTNNNATISFSSQDLPPANVFTHFMCTIEKDNLNQYWICVYQNGILSGKTLVTAQAGQTGAVTRAVQPTGTGKLYIGSCDHGCWTGWIAMVRAWESQCNYGQSAIGAPFVPERVFTNFDYGNNPCDFNASYIVPPWAAAYPDLSYGYDSQGAVTRTQHPGVPFNDSGSGSSGGSGDEGVPGTTVAPYPLPATILSPQTTAPFYYNYTDTPISRGLSPLTPPNGVKLYDSFQRADQTYSHVLVPSAGSIEYSSIGAVQAWQAFRPSGAALARNSPLQIFNGTLRPGDTNPTIAWVNNNSGDMDVRVTRLPLSAYADQAYVGCAFRLNAAATTGFYVYLDYQSGGAANIETWRMDGPGSVAVVAGGTVNVSPSNPWTTLRIVAVGTTLTCYIDATQLYSITETHYTTQTGAGVFFTGYGSAAQTSSAAAQFAVF